MSGKGTKYSKLRYLDNVHQPFCTNGYVNTLKTPLRNAVNGCRATESGMQELIDLLEQTLSHINSIDKPKRKKRIVKKEDEYNLPG